CILLQTFVNFDQSLRTCSEIIGTVVNDWFGSTSTKCWIGTASVCFVLWLVFKLAQPHNNRVCLALACRCCCCCFPLWYLPCFHRWMLANFAVPTRWLESRTLFTRSADVWSAVGHVVGLCDRHGENILIDTTSGECLHVDFDCLIDKGLTLTLPEIVPFRLTPNMVDTMGLTGFEGAFRSVMELAMRMLRENKDM